MPPLTRVIADSDDELNDDSDLASFEGHHGDRATPEFEDYPEKTGSGDEHDVELLTDEFVTPALQIVHGTDSLNDSGSHALDDINFDAFLSQSSTARRLNQGSSQPVKSYPELYRHVTEVDLAAARPSHETQESDHQTSGSTAILLQEIQDAQTDLVTTGSTSSTNIPTMPRPDKEHSADLPFDFMAPMSSLAERVKLKRSRTVEQQVRKNENTPDLSLEKSSKRRKTMKTYGSKGSPSSQRHQSAISSGLGPVELGFFAPISPKRQDYVKSKANDMPPPDVPNEGQLIPDLDNIAFLKSSTDFGKTSDSAHMQPADSHVQHPVPRSPSELRWSSTTDGTPARRQSLGSYGDVPGDTQPFSSISDRSNGKRATTFSGLPSSKLSQDDQDELGLSSAPDRAKTTKKISRRKSELSRVSHIDVSDSEDELNFDHQSSSSKNNRKKTTDTIPHAATDSQADVNDEKLAVEAPLEPESVEHMATTTVATKSTDKTVSPQQRNPDTKIGLIDEPESDYEDSLPIVPKRGRGRPRKNPPPEGSRSDKVVQGPTPSDELVIGNPAEQYKPRPSRSRGGTSDVLEELDTNVPKKKGETKKKKMKRGKTMSVTQVKNWDSEVEDDVIWIEDNATKGVKDDSSGLAAVDEDKPSFGNGNAGSDPVIDVQPVTGPLPTPPQVVIKKAPEPKKRGRKKTKTVEEDVVETQALNAEKPAAGHEDDRGDQPNANIKASEPERATPGPRVEVAEPETPVVKEAAVAEGKAAKASGGHSPISAICKAKTRFRVGLSKRANIPSLLKIRRN